MAAPAPATPAPAPAPAPEPAPAPAPAPAPEPAPAPAPASVMDEGEEEEEDLTKKVEYMKLDVLSVENTGSKKGKGVWYNIHLSNGLVYKRLSEQPLDWVGKSKEFIVTTHLAGDGSVKLDKDGEPKISVRMPNEDDWTLLKKRTETDIETSGKTVGEYIYDNILNKKSEDTDSIFAKKIKIN